MSNLRTEVRPTTFLLLMLYICVPTSVLPVFIAFKTVEDFPPNMLHRYALQSQITASLRNQGLEFLLSTSKRCWFDVSRCPIVTVLAIRFQVFLLTKHWFLGNVHFGWVCHFSFPKRDHDINMTRLQQLKHQLMSSWLIIALALDTNW